MKGLRSAGLAAIQSNENKCDCSSCDILLCDSLCVRLKVLPMMPWLAVNEFQHEMLNFSSSSGSQPRGWDLIGLVS